jgi:ribosomal protein S12 methylthiotransferase accessory factor YcaO
MEDPEHPRQTKTAEELAPMIVEDLGKGDGCPERGVNVTVYGIPWNAMLLFGTAAGPVRNKAELQGFFEIIRERLQRLYDVA